MKKSMNQTKISHTLNWMLLAMALIAIALFVIQLVGTLQAAQLFQRRLTDWQFLWAPNWVNYVLFLAIIILGLMKSRIAILASLYYALQTFWFFFNVIFGDGNTFIAPTILSYGGAICHYTLFIISLAALCLWMVELWRHISRRKNIGVDFGVH